MGFLIPESEMTTVEIAQLRAQIAQNLIAIAARETKRGADSLIVRDIEPKADLGFNLPRFENQTARSSINDEWQSDFTKTLDGDKFVCFYGLIDHAVATKPAAGAAEGYPIKGVSYRVGSGGATVREQVHLQDIQTDHYLTSGLTRFPAGYHLPVYYKGKETINVNLLANADVGQYGDQLELLGYICEPLGNAVSSIEERNPGVVSGLVPEINMTITEIRALREKTRQMLLKVAVAETGRTAADFVVRDPFPKDDFSFNGCEWQNQTALAAASTWTKDWSKLLPKTKFVGFYGYFHQTAVVNPTSQKYTGLRYKLGSSGATTLKQLHLQKAQRACITSVGVTPIIRGYHEPVIYKGEDTIYIEHEGDATTTQYYDGIGLLGLVCEPYGETISGKQ